MTPHVTWAFKQRNMTAAQRLVLIALSERANGDKVCFPSFELIAEDCELSRRSVAAAVHFLSAVRGLISLVTSREERRAILQKLGKNHNLRVNIYRINRPDDAAKSAKSAPTNGAGNAPSHPPKHAKSAPSTIHKRAKSAPHDSATIALDIVQNFPIHGATIAPESLKENLKEPLRATSGAGGGAAALASCGPAAAPPPAPSATIPANDVADATDSGMPPRPPSFEETLAALRARRAAIPLATPEADTLAADLPNATDLAGALSGLARGLATAWQPTPPPQPRPVAHQLAAIRPEPHNPIRSAEQQIAALMATATPDQIARAEAHSRPPMLQAAE